MSRTKPLGLLQYLALNDEERHFYKLFGRLPSDTSTVPPIEIDTKRPQKNKGGRPTVRFQINEKRAYYLWTIAKELPENQRAKITNRELIDLAKTKPFHDVFGNKTQQTTIEQSISRGKKVLDIDTSWNSKVCDLLEKEFHKLQT